MIVFQKYKKKEKKAARYEEKERKVKLQFEKLSLKSYILCRRIYLFKKC